MASVLAARRRLKWEKKTDGCTDRMVTSLAKLDPFSGDRRKENGTLPFASTRPRTGLRIYDSTISLVQRITRSGTVVVTWTRTDG
jgi:hypothetical protein